MSKFQKLFLQLSLPFGLITFLIRYLASGGELFAAVSNGLFNGLLFAFLMTSYINYQEKKVIKNQPALMPGEEIIYSGMASYQKRFLGSAGGLYLTTARLIFKPHRLNPGNPELSLELADILCARRGKMLGLIPNQINVIDKDGEIHKFISQDRKQLKQKIDQYAQRKLQPISVNACSLSN